jgi:hypothetical protein
MAEMEKLTWAEATSGGTPRVKVVKVADCPESFRVKGPIRRADAGEMSRLLRASEPARAEAMARITKETGRLDAWSFWSVPAVDHVVVAGTTGVFLIVPDIHEGFLEGEGRRVRIGGERVRLRPVRVAAARLRDRLGSGAVGVDLVPILCLTRAKAGAPRTVQGVRIVPIDMLASDIARREKVLQPVRAQRVVRTLGMSVAGDQRRHAAVLGRQAR